MWNQEIENTCHNNGSYCIPQLVVNMTIMLPKLIYLYTERLVILKRHAA